MPRKLGSVPAKSHPAFFVHRNIACSLLALESLGVVMSGSPKGFYLTEKILQRESNFRKIKIISLMLLSFLKVRL